MAERSQVISGATVLLMALTDASPQGLPLELVENFSANEATATERITGVGSHRPDENVMHGTTGANVSWGQVLKGTGRNPWADKILAAARDVPTHRPIDIAVIDLNSETTLMIIHSVLPESVGITVGPQTSVRANQSFTATYCSWLVEVN